MKWGRVIVVFVISLLLSENTFSQRRRIDSLKTLLEQRTDTAQIRVRLKLANAYRRVSIDTAINYATRALADAKKLKHIRFEYDATFKLGDFHREKGDFRVSLDHLQRTVEIGTALKDTLGVGQTYNSIGNTYQKQGDYKQALDYFLKSLDIKEKKGDRNGMANTYINIGNVYDHLYAYDKSEEYILKGIQIKEQLGEKYGVAGALNNLSIIYTRRSRPDLAIATLEKIVQGYGDFVDPYMKSAVLGNLAEAYQSVGKIDLAFEKAKECLQLRLDLGDSTEASYAFITIANIEFDKKNYRGVIQYASRALKMSERIGLLKHVWDARVSLGQAYNALGDFKNAAFHYNEALKLTDTLSSDKADEMVHEMEAKYDNDKKEAEIGKLNAQKKINELELDRQEANISRQRWIMIFGALLILCMVAVSVIIFRSYREKKRSNEKLQSAYNTIEEKQKEILDSIYYARRIQSSLFTSVKFIEKTLVRLKKEEKNKA